MKDTFIKVENLSFAYENENGQKIPAVKNVSFTIERGEFVAVLGHNGSGKSTLAKLMNMILTPDSGKIYIDGMDITDEALLEDEDKVVEVRRRIGMVFQNPDNQLVATIVEEDVAFGPENMGVESAEIRRRVDEALATVNMTEFARHSPHQLSGGQKQRIAIAGIIAMLPECIIFDESTAMLDPSGRDEVMRTIQALNRDKGITVLHITHNMNEAVMADRVMVINSGEICLDGTPREVFKNVEMLQSVGLDVPQSTELMYELSREGVSLPGDVLDEDEGAAALMKLFEGNNKNYPKAGPAHNKQIPDVEKRTIVSDTASGTDVELKNITYVYGKGTPFEKKALDDVSLKFSGGRITGLIGHTGSGKSTLVQLLNALLKPENGQILVGGRDIWAEPKKLREVRFKVGLVFQYPEYQLFEETVEADIAYGPKNMGLDDAEIKRRVYDAAKFVGLDPALFSKSPFELSGGQRRRVAIAGVYAMEPDVLILDEPAAGLDPMGREDILGGVRSYQRESGKTVIIVSHSMEDMARYSDEIVVMNKAKLFIFAHSEELGGVGLDIPQITRLFLKLKELGAPVRSDIYTVEDAKAEILRVLAQHKANR